MTTDRVHRYSIDVVWTGNLGSGTSEYRAYSRDHEIVATGKAVLFGSSDPLFRGDSSRYSPEELLVSSLSACHMLWYLHLCADAGITIVEYRDSAVGEMVETPGGGGRFRRVELSPAVRIAPGGDPIVARALHERAHALCFVASSVNFPVVCLPVIEVVSGAR